MIASIDTCIICGACLKLGFAKTAEHIVQEIVDEYDTFKSKKESQAQPRRFDPKDFQSKPREKQEPSKDYKKDKPLITEKNDRSGLNKQSNQDKSKRVEEKENS